MKLQGMVLAGLVLAGGAHGETAPKPEQCRMAVDQGIATLERVPVDRARDDPRRLELLAEMRRMIDEHRRRGVNECEIWGELMRRAANS